MPKLKTVKGVKKRFKLTGTGKLKRKKAFASHILTKKTRKTKRNLRKAEVVTSADQKRLKKMLSV
jgi:large subunit ribosomal protein L35